MAGFAYEEESVPEGLATIAVPVIEGDGQVPVRYMLNAIGPRGDFTGDKLPVLVDAVKRLAEDARRPGPVQF
jgi:DNA-binding IclR family transcriptional regulator